MQEEKYTRFKNEIWKDTNIKGYEKLVLIYLISYNNKTLEYSFPTRKQIQDETGISENTLGKVLDSLIKKKYITRAKRKTKKGWNNIYYIHKYLVLSKKEAPAETINDKNSDDANSNIKKAVEASTNELLVNEKAKVKRDLNDNDREYLKELDTDTLIKAIDRANEFKPKGYHIGYIAKCYDTIKKEQQEEDRQAKESKTSNNSDDNNKGNTGANTKDYHNNNYSVKTKYHDTFNEHFRDYTPDELERKLLKMQAKRKSLA